MLEGKIIEYSQKNSIIIDSTIELTNKCNLKCKHCYIENREFYLSKKEVIEIIDILFLEGTMNLTFTGGEIFSHPNFEEIYIYAKKRGFIIELKTNALLTNQEWINLFMDYPPEEINISVYGLSDEEYSSFTGDKSGFKKLINSLDGMYSNCIPFSLHVISTNLNYPDIINGNYKIFFEKYDLEFAFDYDILSSLEGNEFPLNYRLSDDKIVYLENNEHFYFENIEKEYINMKNDKKEFICSGGKTKVFFASNGTVSSCSFDRENSHKFSKENWIFIKKELNARNDELNEFYKKSKCYSCEKGLMCRVCPLKKKRSPKDDAQCKLSKKRIENINKNSKKYEITEELAIFKEYTHIDCKLIFSNLGIDMSTTEGNEDYFSEISNPIIEYEVNGENIIGSRGKTFYYLPIKNKKIENELGLTSGNALKIIRNIELNEVETVLNKLKKIIEISEILWKEGFASKCHRILILKNIKSTTSFVNKYLINYPENSYLIGLEVEHLDSIKFGENENIFNGKIYENDIIVEVIGNKLTSLGIKYKDLWVGNLLNTEKGIQLIDFYDWDLID